MTQDSYNAAAGALREVAAAHGLQVHRIGELRRFGSRCEPILGALVNELEHTSSRELLEELANVLAAPWARAAALRPLAQRFQTTPNSPPKTKAALAQALALVASDRDAPVLIELASNRSHGNARALLVVALGGLDDVGVLDALVDLLRDPGVGGHAVTALLSYVARNREAIDEALIKPFLRDGRPWARKDAKELLQTLDTLDHRAQGDAAQRAATPPLKPAQARRARVLRRKP